jgi:hypothetical protein
MVDALSEARLQSAAGVAKAPHYCSATEPVLCTTDRCTTDLAAAIQNATRHIRNPTTATYATGT